MSEFKTGDPVIMKDARGMKKYGLHKNMKGFCRGEMSDTVEGKEYVSFMPNGTDKVFIVGRERLILDEEKLKELEAE